jgi:hypothetical protein
MSKLAVIKWELAAIVILGCILLLMIALRG